MKIGPRHDNGAVGSYDVQKSWNAMSTASARVVALYGDGYWESPLRWI